MLKHLHIRNLAIIDELELDFGAGFSALTGETGAGKSILIDAIGLVTGARADPQLVRHGAERAEVSAEFSLEESAPARAWLEQQELADADHPAHCLLRRVVYAEGRTRAFVNGVAVNAGQLRELGEQLVEVFGQSESQTLMRAPVQRALLDQYGVGAAALDAVSAAAADHAELSAQIDRLRAAGPQDPARTDYQRFQLQELEALNLGDDEWTQLEADHRRLAHAGRLLQEGGAAQEALYGGDQSLYDQLAAVHARIGALVPLHEGLSESLALTESAQAQLREAADVLRRHLDRLDLDPEHLAQIERRLAAVHDLARKHRARPEELPARIAALRAELADSENVAGRLAELEQRQQAALARYRKAAAALTAQRHKAADKMAPAVTAIIRTLGMGSGEFRIDVTADAAGAPRPHGDDEIRFDFSANPGQPPRPLAKVASGGELSRLSLALQVVALTRGGAPCMIFDEIDAGIGGGTAEIVGRTLRRLGAGRQVLCVTHLAQVAAQAHQQFGIRKEVRRGQTFTRVASLGEAERIEELARMQGGLEVSGAAVDHARELLAAANRGG
jgi:DNA repair protein RecN (Recombination protein N)